MCIARRVGTNAATGSSGVACAFSAGARPIGGGHGHGGHRELDGAGAAIVDVMPTDCSLFWRIRRAIPSPTERVRKRRPRDSAREPGRFIQGSAAGSAFTCTSRMISLRCTLMPPSWRRGVKSPGDEAPLRRKPFAEAGCAIARFVPGFRKRPPQRAGPRRRSRNFGIRRGSRFHPVYPQTEILRVCWRSQATPWWPGPRLAARRAEEQERRRSPRGPRCGPCRGPCAAPGRSSCAHPGFP